MNLEYYHIEKKKNIMYTKKWNDKCRDSLMYKYVVDTNVLYGLAFNDEIHCITENALNILKGNIGSVTYGTLFEAFDRYET